MYVQAYKVQVEEHFSDSAVFDQFPAGFINTTSAITEIDFKMASGNMDGTIKMYGVG